MTPRERVDAALHGEMPDAVPFTVYECMLPKSAAERRLRNEGLCIVERSSVFKTVYHEVKIERTSFLGEDGLERTRTEVTTPAGKMTAIDRPAGFTSWHDERLFHGPEDYDALEWMIADRTYEPRYEEFAELQALMGDDASVRAGIGYSPLQEIIYTLMGVTEFSIQWAENRDRLLRLYNALVEDRRRIYEVVAHSPAQTVNYGGNVSPEVVGKERFETMILPHYEEAAEVLQAQGIMMGVHFDANTRLLAPGIARSRMDYVEAFTPSPDTDMTVREAREAWPHKTLWINFPSSIHLDSTEAIADMTRSLLREAAPGNRFIIGITEDLPPGRWQGNFEAILEVCNTFGRTPIAG